MITCKSLKFEYEFNFFDFTLRSNKPRFEPIVIDDKILDMHASDDDEIVFCVAHYVVYMIAGGVRLPVILPGKVRDCVIVSKTSLFMMFDNIATVLSWNNITMKPFKFQTHVVCTSLCSTGNRVYACLYPSKHGCWTYKADMKIEDGTIVGFDVDDDLYLRAKQEVYMLRPNSTLRKMFNWIEIVQESGQIDWRFNPTEGISRAQVIFPHSDSTAN